MRNLTFSIKTDAPVNKIWIIISDINSYHKYIKYCHKSKLVGDFKEGSSWYDWSTVVFLPLKINHLIIKIIPGKQIGYLIKTPFGEIRQKITIKKGKKTLLRLDVTINFPNWLIDKTLGNFVYLRNYQMLKTTMKNYKDDFKDIED